MSNSKKSWLHKLLLLLSYLAIVALSSRPKLYLLDEDLRLLIGGCVILLLVPRRFLTLPARRPGFLPCLIMALFTIGFFFTFRKNWLGASKVMVYVARYGIPWAPLIYFLAVFGCLFSLLLQWKLLYEEGRILQRIETEAKAGQSAVGKFPMSAVKALLILAIVCLQFVMLQLGLALFPQNMYTVKIAYYLANLGLLLAGSLVLVLIVQRWRLAMLVSSVFFCIWGIANHYVVLFHGGPLLLSELASAGTALDVLSDYRFTLRGAPWVILAIAVMTFRLVRTLWIVDRGAGAPFFRRLAVRLALLAAAAGLPALVLLRPDAPALLGWSYYHAVSVYGFGSCVVEDAMHMIHPYSEPEGYSADRLPEAEAVSAGTDVAPDIILILNESFCDLDYYTSVNADRDYMGPFYNLEGSAHGWAVVPMVGGGTNNSEYELLTANSMYLVSAPAPFNFIDFTKNNSNAVQYLKRLGYTSCALHFQSSTNYSRNTAYPAMGFDSLWLGWSPSIPDIRYGNRGGLDSTYYELLRQKYESYTGEEPRFLYMLTYQNHGGFEKNDPSMATVHARTDFGDRTKSVNEYMTSIAMSCDAFGELVEYFSRVDRPVIVCMVGDHVPSFLPGLDTEKERSELEEALAQRTVPYVIWSNYGADLSRCGEYTSMYALMPEVLRSAGLPLTTYYRSILALREVFPVTSAAGICRYSDGAVFRYDPTDPLCGPVTDYFCMEYNALKSGEDYREELFLPPAD